MTHNELLDAVYWHWRKDDRGDGLKPMIDYRSVILAVVKLHKPTPLDERGDVCLTCCPDLLTLYPCPTIQAIEEHLK